MDFSQFNDDSNEPANIAVAKNFRHMNTDSLIEPWINNNIFNNLTQRLKKKDSHKATEKVFTQRKKTTDQRIEQIYRKYSKEDIVKNRENGRVNSREIYREMLKQFQKTPQFKQIGPRVEKLELQIGSQSFSLELLRKKVSSYTYGCPFDYKQITLKQPVITPQQKMVNKCSEKFQKMLKIREKIRKKNNLSVSKQKQKYLSEYNPILLYTQREQSLTVAPPGQRSKAKIRIKSHLKLNYSIYQNNNGSIRIGTPYSAFGQSLNRQKQGIRDHLTKNSKARFAQTAYSYRE